MPFACIALRDAAALARARLDRARWADALAGSGADNVYAFAPGADPGTLRARMFAPALGVEEDPATGAAAAAVAGLLGGLAGPGEHGWVIDQGVEMGRPSRLALRYTATAAGVEQARLGGCTVVLGGGSLRAPPPADERS